MTKVIISNDKCVGCGACLNYKKVFEETSDGKAKIKGEGIVDQEELSIVTEIADLCPENAILLDTTYTNVDKKVIFDKLDKLISFQVPLPEYKDIDFSEVSSSFETSCSRYISPYTYKSERAAEKEAMSQLKNGVFNRFESIGKHLLHDYQEQILSRILTYDHSESNYAWKTNKGLSDELLALRQQIESARGSKLSLPKDYTTIDISPDFSRTQEKNNFSLYVFTHISETYLPNQMRENVESPDWYDSWIDIDYMEDYRGKDVYNFNIADAVLQIKEHYFQGAYPAVEEYVKKQLSQGGKYFAEIYKPINDLVHEKAKTLLNELQKL